MGFVYSESLRNRNQQGNNDNNSGEDIHQATDGYQKKIESNQGNNLVLCLPLNPVKRNARQLNCDEIVRQP